MVICRDDAVVMKSTGWSKKSDTPVLILR